MSFRPSLFRKRSVGLVLALVMLAGALPFAGLASADGGSGVSPVTFTSTLSEIVDPGTSWVDDSGYHFRNMQRFDVVSGDLTGTSEVTMNGDFVAGDVCATPDCDGDYSMGDLELWGTITVHDDAGWWSGLIGRTTLVDGSSVARIMMTGHGGNAGRALVGDYEVQATDDGGTATVITGEIVTVAGPKQGLSVYFGGCAVPPAGGAGAMLLNLGDGHHDAGNWQADYPLSQPNGVSFGDVTMTTDDGEISAYLMVQAHGPHRIGLFVVTGGEGEHEELLGFGKVRTNRFAAEQCPNNAGLGGFWIGEATF